jgi:anti-anti-sigma factor
LLPEADSVTIDFEKLEYISSAGLRVLLAAEQAMEEKGGQQVKVVNLNDTIRNIFNITGFEDVLSLE